MTVTDIDPSNANPVRPPILLEPLPYQTVMKEILKRSDPEIWQWFASQRTSAKYAEDVRFELLKTTYRIDRESQPALYEVAELVSADLGLAAPITIYQSQDPERLNASLAYVPGEVHLVLHGPIAAQLSAMELRGLIGHELAHYLLWDRWDGELLITSEILQALVTDAQAHPAHFASWRLYRLYAEIFCDRVALSLTADLLALVSMLAKVQTGVQEVDPVAYLRQSEEIFSRGPTSTDGTTHPEAYIRARAAQLWNNQDPNANQIIADMIEGEPTIDCLDLLTQEKMTQDTRRVIDAFLCHRWLQTEPLVAHARLYFEDYAPPKELLTDASLGNIRTKPDSVRDYFAFVLLDFITAERDLEEAPLAAALMVADEIGIKPRLLELARQELKLRKTQLDKIDQNKSTIVSEADRVTAAPL